MPCWIAERVFVFLVYKNCRIFGSCMLCSSSGQSAWLGSKDPRGWLGRKSDQKQLALWGTRVVVKSSRLQETCDVMWRVFAFDICELWLIWWCQMWGRGEPGTTIFIATGDPIRRPRLMLMSPGSQAKPWFFRAARTTWPWGSTNQEWYELGISD